ncbi:MAG: methyltransferase domain-containing protein [Candidatus Diapherotrites archaeon]|nr:methyltransferase domain-containing protein [Candidatus Diapherotrites archaeon]
MPEISKQELKELRFFAKKKFSRAREMFFPSKAALEQATPEKVAFYRAGRLKAGIGVDLCCGIGMDAIALAKNCKRVFAFDNDAEAIECAKMNAKAYGCRNIEFIRADYRKADLKALKAEVVFADPSRRSAERREKDLHKTQPDTRELIEFAKKAGVEIVCVEVSHELALKDLPADCEKEFVSLEHEPNCVSLYFGKLKKAVVSAVVLPEGERIEGDGAQNSAPDEKLGGFLFELDEIVGKAGLKEKLLEALGGKAWGFNEKFLSADEELASAFFKNRFRVLETLENADESALVPALQRLGTGKVVLRGKFGQEEQLAMKKRIEEKLSGKEKLHAFFFGKKAAVCRNIDFKALGG